MQITTGKNRRAQKVVIYGPEGIGKSTFASQFPGPLFSDVEGSTDELDVARLPKPSSWEMILQQVQYLKNNPQLCSTWIIDTADWAEKLCMAHICAKANKGGIEDFGYGKGYVYLEEEFGRFLNLCSDLLDVGINVVFTAHAQPRKFEQPDEMGSYDRWELKLKKQTSPLLKEWADCILFVNYKTYVVKTEDKKNKAQGGARTMYTTHHSCWDAKNRYGLPESVPFEFKQISPFIPSKNTPQTKTEPVKEVVTQPVSEPVKEVVKEPEPEKKVEPQQQREEPPQKVEIEPETEIDVSGIPKALADLMLTNNVTKEDIQKAVAHKGYYPMGTPISNYDSEFINGVLVAAWTQVFSLIQYLKTLPF